MFKPLDSTPNFSALEEEVLVFWEQEQIFAKSLEATKSGLPYVTYDGPPTANAKPALHHTEPSAFKDAAARYATMRGHFVRRQAGWDTHGLPVEVQVEKALGLAGKKEVLSIVPGNESASISAFNKACQESVWTYKQDWEQFIRRSGRWLDFADPYITYETKYIEGVWSVLKQIWDRDLVFKDYKVLPYCPRCGTGLSAAEVAQEYQDIKDVSVYVTFPLLDKPERSFIAWTTTPWTLPGHVALAIGPTITYVVIKQGEQEYILAKDRLEIVDGDFVILEEMLGQELLGLKYQTLFPGVLDQADGHKFLTVPANFVTTTDGSGIVHTACMYGEDDFNLGKQEGLAMSHTVGLDGHFLEQVPEFGGLEVREALVPILKSLTEKGRLYKKQTITHSYPHCWRCKTPLIYYAKDSWYIRMSSLRSDLLKANAAVEWIPDHIKEGRFGDFIKEARDWAISRERFWGTPLPIWKSASGKWLCIGSLDELRQLAKTPLPDNFNPHRPDIDQIILVKDGEEYQREPFVMDVWFDSGAMPFASGAVDRQEYPADYIAEAIDQTRGWFYSLMAIGVCLSQGSPYKRVVCMGHLVDADGRKMSKSVGNVIDPMDAFATCTADAVRWFIFTVNAPGESKAVSLADIQMSYRKSFLPLWNVCNYFVTYANLQNWQPGQTSPPTLLDRWILSKLNQMIIDLTRFYDDSDFLRVGRSIETFIQELSTWYLRRSRKRTDLAFFATLHQVLTQVTRLMAPLAPFLPETIYKNLNPDSLSVHLDGWPEPDAEPDLELEEAMSTARRLVELGLAARAQAKIRVRQPLQKVKVTIPELSEELSAMILEELDVAAIEYNQAPTEPEIWVRNLQSEQLWLDPTITPELAELGEARDLLRQLQNLRKQQKLKPGQTVKLRFGSDHADYLKPLFANNPEILASGFFSLDDASWQQAGEIELQVNGRNLLVSLEE